MTKIPILSFAGLLVAMMIAFACSIGDDSDSGTDGATDTDTDTDTDSDGDDAGSSGGEGRGVVTPDEGGTITLGGAQVVVPPGAVDDPTLITLIQLDPTTVVGMPPDYTPVGPMIALLPHGQAFNKPVTVTLTHTSKSADDDLAIFRLDNEEDASWESFASPSFASGSASFETMTFSVVIPAGLGAQVIYTDTAPVPIGHMALEGGTLFYAVNYQTHQATIDIRSVNIDGSSPTILANFEAPFKKTIAIAATPTTVYFSAGNLYSIPRAGGSPTDTELLCGGASGDYDRGINLLLIDGTTIYCKDQSNLSTATLTGEPRASFTVVNPGGLYGMTLDGSNLLYGMVFNGLYTVPKAAFTAEDSTEVIAGDEFEAVALPVCIAHDATYLYVLTNTSTHTALWRKPRAGGAIESVIAPDTLAGRARGLLLLDDKLYFSLKVSVGQGPGYSMLMRIDKTADSGTAEELGGANPFHILTDGSYLYYANGNDILRMAK
jgi:hypothetical protein